MRFEVATGKPAVEVLRVAKERPPNLIVMSTHGLTGVRKLFFGSTTERVLRETTVPILLTPAHDHGPARPDDVRRAVKRILVPVDFSPATLDQVTSARDVAASLEVPVLLAHVVEPVHFAVSGLPHMPNIDVERRSRAEQSLAELTPRIPAKLRPEALVAYGDPAEEISKMARDRDAGLIVIGLHASAAAWSAHGIGDVPRALPHGHARSRAAAVTSRSEVWHFHLLEAPAAGPAGAAAHDSTSAAPSSTPEQAWRGRPFPDRGRPAGRSRLRSECGR